MWMSEACVVINPKNADGNSLKDIINALEDIGAHVEHIDEERHVIEVLVPASEISTLHLIDGVSYVRAHCQYHVAAPASAA